MKRLVSDWPNAVAHVDADCFYVACEFTRRPDLIGKPLAVMSSQDACIVAKSYDAKAQGIATGMSVWDARRKMPSLILLPADFRFYGLMSRKMFAVLARFSPEIERYSIDEAFLDMNGLRGLFRCGYAELADRMRRAVREELGITVSVGIAVNKLLAKMASESNKPDGSTVVPGRSIAAFLAEQPCKDIPGIGQRRAALLRKFGLHTAHDFASAEIGLIRRLLGKAGIDLWRELNGESVFPLETGVRLPRSMARTASLGRRTNDRKEVERHLAHHAFRLAMDMTAQGLRASRLRVMLRLGDFRRVFAEITLEQRTSNYHRIVRAAKRGLAELWRTGIEVGACGVIATRLEWANSPQQDLFPGDNDDERMLPLWNAMASINRKYGSGTIQPAAATSLGRKSAQPRFRYPVMEV